MVKIFIVIVLIFIMLMNIIMVVAKKKIVRYLKKYLATDDLKQVIKLSELENQNTPKSLSGMESVSLPLIQKDFPNLNINELKRQTETSILNYFDSLENKKYNEILNASENVKTYIVNRINDLLVDDEVKYDSIKIHRTIVKKYEKKDDIATIYFQTSLEYMYKKNDNDFKKVQDRFETEYIYIIDVDKIDSRVKQIGLNCPNCGAPIKSIGNKTCQYCGSGVVDVVKHTWYLNNISNI